MVLWNSREIVLAVLTTHIKWPQGGAEKSERGSRPKLGKAPRPPQTWAPAFDLHPQRELPWKEPGAKLAFTLHVSIKAF